VRPAVWERESNLPTVSPARRFSPQLRCLLDCWQAVDSMRAGYCFIVALMTQVAVTFARKELLEELNNEYCNLPVSIHMLVPFKRLQARELRRGEGKI
jgi:hypothetical protein